MEITLNDLTKMQKAIKMQMKVLNNAIHSALEDSKNEKIVEPSKLDGVVINEIVEHGAEQSELTGLD